MVSHDDFQGKIDVSVTYPDLESIKSMLPDMLAAIPARRKIEQGKPKFTFNMETTGILLDEVSVTTKRKRAGLKDKREKPNSVHYRNTDNMCIYGVLNCTTHGPYFGYKGQGTEYSSNGVIYRLEGAFERVPLHLWEDENGKNIVVYKSFHNLKAATFPYPLTFLDLIESKERIRNVQEHYFWEEQVFGFYSELISQAYGPLSLLYFSEIELPKLYFNAYLVIELIHHPSGSRQQVVKKIGAGTQALN